MAASRRASSRSGPESPAKAEGGVRLAPTGRDRDPRVVRCLPVTRPRGPRCRCPGDRSSRDSRRTRQAVRLGLRRREGRSGRTPTPASGGLGPLRRPWGAERGVRDSSKEAELLPCRTGDTPASEVRRFGGGQDPSPARRGSPGVPRGTVIPVQ
jgi:hypothetical protein